MGLTGFIGISKIGYSNLIFLKNLKKNLKKLESISKFLVKIKFKNSKKCILQNLLKPKML
jgi:hypothetical protein